MSVLSLGKFFDKRLKINFEAMLISVLGRAFCTPL